MNADLETFGIDPSDADAQLRSELATYLRESGLGVEEIARSNTLAELHRLVWSKIFGVAGEPVSVSAATERSGLTEGQLRRILGALGFANELTDDAVITEQDIDLFEAFDAMVLALGEDQLIQLARVIGSSARRVAEAAAATTRVGVETPMLQQGGSYLEFLRSTADFVELGLGLIGRMLDRVLRYHMLAVSREAWGVDAEASAVTMRLAVGFADMVGFTSHSASLSTRDLAGVIDGFEGRVSEVITSSGGRVVKFIGDEVMFTFAEPAAACRCGQRLLALAADAHIPDVRVGIAYGDVISRYGDYYGPVVNLASRLVDIAPSGGVFVTADVAERAKDAFAFDEQPPRDVKGIDRPVEHLRLVTS